MLMGVSSAVLAVAEGWASLSAALHNTGALVGAGGSAAGRRTFCPLPGIFGSCSPWQPGAWVVQLKCSAMRSQAQTPFPSLGDPKRSLAAAARTEVAACWVGQRVPAPLQAPAYCPLPFAKEAAVLAHVCQCPRLAGSLLHLLTCDWCGLHRAPTVTWKKGDLRA